MSTTAILIHAGVAFLLAFPALIAIINPFAGAFAFLAITRHASDADREATARAIATYGFALLSAALWVGAYVLEFFGISLGVLRVGGGIVVAMAAWRMLNAVETSDAAPAEGVRATELGAMAFYPLTMPLTVGPGTMAVAIALGTNRAPGVAGLIEFVIAATAATIACAGAIYLTYRYAERVTARFGVTGTQVVMRLSAFLLFCIGLQVLWNGVAELVGGLPRG